LGTTTDFIKLGTEQVIFVQLTKGRWVVKGIPDGNVTYQGRSIYSCRHRVWLSEWFARHLGGRHK
jgi:hypothetical protein